MCKWGMVESIERLSFELSTRALAEQERMLAGMRATAGTLIAAASVVASLRTPSTSPISFGGVVALAACALCVACAVWVLLPHGLIFVVSGGELRLVDRHQRPRGVAAAHHVASLWAERRARANRRVLARIALSLSLGCVLLLIEIVSLILAAAW
jgi:hypothetical protein